MNYKNNRYLQCVLRSLLISAIVIGTLCLCECVLRYSSKDIYNKFVWTNIKNYQRDSDLIYSRIPYGHWVTKTDEFEEDITANNLGFRDVEIKNKDTDHEYRIIAVGDSFTFGHGIAETYGTYPKRLEQLLNTDLVGKKKYQ